LSETGEGAEKDPGREAGELKATGTAHFFNFLLNTTDYRILLKDEDHDRMYVGSKDYVLSLDLHDINREPLIIHWAASQQRIEECVLSGKDGNGECGNFVRLIQPWNRTHLYVCGTGAYNPMCTYVNRGRRAQPKPAPPAPATPSSNPRSSSSQATPWTQAQVVRGRGSRATDGALRPTPTAPRQVGLIPLGLCQAALPLSGTHPGPAPEASLPKASPLPLCPHPVPSPSPEVPSGSEGMPSWTHVGLSVTPTGKK
ncbi:Semaphorin-3F, partial [Saguinus oedipus]